MIIRFLFSKFVDYIQLRKFSRYQKLFKHPLKAQKKSLELILERTKGCEVRKKLGISDTISFEEFRKNCPITSYEDYEEYTSILFDKELRDDLLNRQKPSYFIATSGTTSRPKIFPVTDFYREEFQRVFLAWLGRIKQLRPQAFKGKSLYLADAAIVGHSPTGIPYGVLSGYNFRKIPKALREILYCTHENFYELGDPKKRDITLLAHALSNEVTNIGTVMPETIIQFLNKFFDYGSEVIEYMERGLPTFDYPPEFEKSLILDCPKENIERAKQLLSKNTWNSLHDFFPQLNTIICWKGATAKFYFDKIKSYIPQDVLVWDAIYSASEGVFNLPDDPHSLGGPLAIDGNFIEFRKIEAPESELLTVDQLRVGEQYEIFCTTSMGLFRYQVNDCIEVTGMRDRTPIIEFKDKTGLFLNHAMERITISHVCELIEDLKDRLSLRAEKLFYFTLCSCEKGDSFHYLLIIETDYDESVFSEINIDELFFRINPNYKRNVEGGLLAPMELRILQKGYLKYELQQREEKGQTMAQFKYSPIEKDPTLAKRLCPCSKAHHN